jgi:hypothetical protein
MTEQPGNLKTVPRLLNDRLKYLFSHTRDPPDEMQHINA